jgi:putative Holliday junction resolvase
MRILAVDPGEKRIGIAISDPTNTISRPLMVLKHVSRQKDAESIVQISDNEDVGLIIVGWPLDSNGEVGYQARKSERLANVLRKLTSIHVEMWDESGTTQEAVKSRIAMGVSRKKRRSHLDDVAASLLLQDYLMCHQSNLSLGDE